jgi:DNA helicase HerA-like ATPase
MRNGFITGSLFASGIVVIPNMNEQRGDEAIEYSKGGVFVGRSLEYSMPFFLNFRSLLNPHTFILGMSGSGKTYLMKSLMLKIYSLLGCKIVVIDLNGEYAELSNTNREDSSLKLDRLFGIEDQEGNKEDYAIIYYDLKNLEEKEKSRRVSDLLNKIDRNMRFWNADGDFRVFIFLDEAWKFLKEINSLESIVREGRKYGVGIVMASQMLEDIDIPMLYNSAVLFVFRIQNKNSLNKLSKSYGLDEKTLNRIQNLEVGECFVVQTHKTKRRDAFFIKQVIGVRLRDYLTILFGDDMIKVEYGRFRKMVNELVRDDPSDLIRKISAEKEVELSYLVACLIRLKADRRKMLRCLMKLKIPEEDISDAFAIAMVRGDVDVEG